MSDNVVQIIHDITSNTLDSSQILLKKRQIKKELLEQTNLQEKRVAILSGSTIGEIKDILEIFLLAYGIKPTFYIGAYLRFYEESVFENSKLDDFNPEIIYIHTSTKNILEYPHTSNTTEQTDSLLKTTFQRFESAWNSLSSKYSCPIIINNFEMLPYRIMGNADSYNQNGRIKFIIDLNALVSEYVNKHSNIYVNDINYLSSRYGLDKWCNPLNWYLYKYALTIEAITDL